jgi:hypothetical protein
MATALRKKYRILRGKMVQGREPSGPNEKPGKFIVVSAAHRNPDGSLSKRGIAERKRGNDVVVSGEDLMLENVPGSPMPRFELLDTVDDGASVEDTLESLSVDQLRRAAEAEEIDLGDARRKPELIAAIRQARGVAPS